MVPNELLEELRGTWGPPTKDPESRAIWEETMQLYRKFLSFYLK